MLPCPAGPPTMVVGIRVVRCLTGVGHTPLQRHASGVPSGAGTTVPAVQLYPAFAGSSLPGGFNRRSLPGDFRRRSRPALLATRLQARLTARIRRLILILAMGCAAPGMELIDDDEVQEVLDVLRGGYLFRYGISLGPEVDPRFKGKVYQVEEEVARLSGVRYAVAVNSGTSALLVALAGLGIGPGDEVIVPGYTFIASMSSIVFAGAVPVLTEIDRTFNLDPDDVEAKITPRTRAIMAVHMAGNPARLDALKAIADAHNLALIEDCAQAFGASYKGRPIGSTGHCGTFS